MKLRKMSRKMGVKTVPWVLDWAMGQGWDWVKIGI